MEYVNLHADQICIHKQEVGIVSPVNAVSAKGTECYPWEKENSN